MELLAMPKNGIHFLKMADEWDAPSTLGAEQQISNAGVSGSCGGADASRRSLVHPNRLGSTCEKREKVLY